MGSITVRRLFLQNRWWVIHGGCIEEGPDQGLNQMHVFDIKGMHWILSPVPPAQLGYRSGHTATCHNGQLLIMGGVYPLIDYRSTLTASVLNLCLLSVLLAALHLLAEVFLLGILALTENCSYVS